MPKFQDLYDMETQKWTNASKDLDASILESAMGWGHEVAGSLTDDPIEQEAVYRCAAMMQFCGIMTEWDKEFQVLYNDARPNPDIRAVQDLAMEFRGNLHKIYQKYVEADKIRKEEKSKE